MGGTSLSPTGNFVIYSTYQSPQGTKSTSVTHHVTKSGYTEEQKTQTKVGSEQTRVEMAIFDIENRDISLLGPVWNETKDLAAVVALSKDHKDRWILLLDPATGKLDLLDRQRDEAWIGDPGIGGWGFSTGEMGWMSDGKSIWFHSEKTGYSHLYAVNIETKKKTTLTSGEFEISEASISTDKKHFYFTANKVHQGVTHFYKMPVWGGELTQITLMEGGNEVTISPDEKYFAIRFSFANKPEELYLQENNSDAKAIQITHSTTEEFNAYNWQIPEFITFEAEDGDKLHARLYLPIAPEKQGPAVIFVHGAGYLQNAHKWWSTYSHEYMFHDFLADNGYTVLDIDYRGSAGYGRDWRTGIYRHMGGKDLSDNVDGAKMLVSKYDISPERIGLYGGSYGGFITLMAMFNNPDVFAAGGALRSVTDWAHYNHGYTANILNTPVEAHGFLEPSSWTDEYKRIFKLFEKNLKY